MGWRMLSESTPDRSRTFANSASSVLLSLDISFDEGEDEAMVVVYTASIAPRSRVCCGVDGCRVCPRKPGSDDTDRVLGKR
jgi:hypothetical protein